MKIQLCIRQLQAGYAPPAESRRKNASVKAAKANLPRVRREKQGRAGKEVTVIRDIPGSAETIRKYANEIKKQCGAGGSMKDGIILIQGNHVDFILEYFTAHGLKIKKDGG